MTARGEQLLLQLQADGASFHEDGLAYALLEECFEGHPVESLGQFLAADKDRDTVRAAIWVASELGRSALPLLSAVVAIVESDDRYIRYHALEVIGVCAPRAEAKLLAHVFAAVSDEDPVIRKVAMRLLCFMPAQHLDVGMSAVNQKRFPGITLLETGTAAAEVRDAMAGSSSAQRRFACVAACRRRATSPELIAVALQHPDEELRAMSQEIAEVSSGAS